MPLFAGRILLPNRTTEGWIEVDGGRIKAFGLDEAPTERPDATGWIVPSAVNAHTHAADTFLRDVPGKPTDLAQLVGPGGWKHTHLAKGTPEEMVAGMERLYEESAQGGAPLLIDFREGGADGLRLARQADVQAQWFGRPSTNTFDEDEADDVLALGHGIGLSAMRDFARARDVERWAEAAQERRKPFALHVSEGVREDMDRAIALNPRFVVHACQATRGDMDALADASIPIVVCPRSNRFFGIKPNVPAMLKAGLTVAIGTDNGMLQSGDVWAELGQLQAWFPELRDDVLLRMACYGGRRVAQIEAPQLRVGAAADWVVLPPKPVPRGSKDKPVLAPREDPDVA